MVERNPVYVSDICYGALDLRLLTGGIVCSDGVTKVTDLEVTETTPASGSVNVALGGVFLGKDGPVGSDTNGRYFAFNDDDVELVVPLNSTGSNRTDVVWAQVCDSDLAAVTSGFTLVYDDNNPTMTMPTDGCFYYLLASLVIPNGSGTGGGNVTNAMITDEREVYTQCGAEL